MPIRYKINVLDALKEKGYNTGKIRKEKIMGEAMLQKIREGQTFEEEFKNKYIHGKPIIKEEYTRRLIKK